MPALRIGLQLAALGMPFKRAIARAAELGVTGVELEARGELAPKAISQTGIRQLRKQLDDSGLTVTALAFRTRRGYDTLDALDRRVEATRDALRLAYALGAPIVINHVGSAAPANSEGEDPRRKLLVDVLSDLAGFGQQVGATLAADTGPDTGPDLAALLDEVHGGIIAANLDPAGTFINGQSTVDVISALGDKIWHAYANDATRDLSRRQGYQVQLGRGSVDFPAILGALAEHNYRGYFTISHPGTGSVADDVAAAVAYLESS